jgi:DNA-binding MarR family transcriptional regulator
VSVTSQLGRYASRAAGASHAAALWHTLIELQRQHPQRLGELAVAARVTQPTMTGIVSRLDELGWIERVRDADDGRVSLIDATAEGLAALENWRTRIDETMAPLFDDLSEEESAALSLAVDLIEGRLRRLENADPLTHPSVAEV